MSRVAKRPVNIPAGVKINIDLNEVTVNGPLGTLRLNLPDDNVDINEKDNTIIFSAKRATKHARAMSGTLRSLINNMVIGVSKGFERKLELVGVGYRAQAKDNVLNLSLGFSHPVTHPLPIEIKVETPSQTEIVLKGIDKQLLGQIAAEIRAYRPPEPYKGKGIRYTGEKVLLKETKKK